MQGKGGFLQRVIEILASMKLTIVIFFTLAAVSVIGTLFPQGLTDSAVHQHFSPTTAWLIETLGLHDLYRTGWFRVLLLVLCLNLTICTLQRLPKTLKLLRHRDEHLTSDKLTKFSHNFQMTTPLSGKETAASLQKVFQEGFGPLKETAGAGNYAGLAERGRWSTLMVYLIHLSVLVILVGALMGSLFGFKGVMNILEGEATAMVVLPGGHERIELPFSVRCDAFSMAHYETGMVREYRSDLAILEEGKEVLKRSIRVNDPLTHQGVTFYQSTYGSLLDRVDVELTDTDTGRIIPMTMRLREPKTVPGTTDQLQAMDYREDIGRMGPAVVIAMLREGEEPTGAWILMNMPEFHGNRIANYRIAVSGSETKMYTGLQVKKDPGVWVVWAGFTAMLIGIALAYFMSHKRVWVVAEPSGGGASSTRVTIAGRTNRNPLAFEEEFQEICQKVRKELEASDKKDTAT